MRTRSPGRWPFAQSSDNRDFPQFTLDNFLEFYYRVKVWAFDYSASEDGVTFTTGSGLFNNLETFIVGPPADEQQIRLFSQIDRSGTVAGGYGWGVVVDCPPAIGVHYIPNIIVNITIPDREIRSQSNVDDPQLGPDEMPFYGTFMGLPLNPFYGYAGSEIYGTFDVYPDEWWPYEKSDNSDPIWNSATGAQLLDPHQTDELPSQS